MIRPAVAADWNIITDSWLKSYRISEHAKPIRSTEYFAGHQLVVERLLSLHGASVLCDDADERVVLAWACVAAPDTLHYVYVKRSCRGLGMSSELLRHCGVYAAAPLYISHLTEKVRRWQAKDRYIRYDPYRGIQ